MDALQVTPHAGTALQNVKAILDGSEKMAKMIEDLLDTARIEGGQVTFEKEPLALNTLRTLIAAKFRQKHRFESQQMPDTRGAARTLCGPGSLKANSA